MAGIIMLRQDKGQCEVESHFYEETSLIESSGGTCVSGTFQPGTTPSFGSDANIDGYFVALVGAMLLFCAVEMILCFFIVWKRRDILKRETESIPAGDDLYRTDFRSVGANHHGQEQTIENEEDIKFGNTQTF